MNSPCGSAGGLPADRSNRVARRTRRTTRPDTARDLRSRCPPVVQRRRRRTGGTGRAEAESRQNGRMRMRRTGCRADRACRQARACPAAHVGSPPPGHPRPPRSVIAAGDAPRVRRRTARRQDHVDHLSKFGSPVLVVFLYDLVGFYVPIGSLDIATCPSSGSVEGHSNPQRIGGGVGEEWTLSSHEPDCPISGAPPPHGLFPSMATS